MAGNKRINEYNASLTAEERRERASKAGKASRAAAKNRNLLQNALIKFLKSKPEENGPTYAELMAETMIKKAIEEGGSISAFELVRDSSGEKPENTSNVNMSGGVYMGFEPMPIDTDGIDG